MAGIRELRDLGDQELFNLRFQLATGQLDNPMRIKDVRHEIARILTIVTQRGSEHEHDEGPRAESEAEAS